MSAADCPLGRRCAACRVCPLPMQPNRVRFVPTAAALYDARAAKVRASKGVTS